MKEFRLFSDGGGDRGSSAAGACIVECEGKRHCYIIFLGTATNNESEISACLLGLAAIRAFLATDSSQVRVIWTSDSEYALKSATQYINNWQKNSWKTASREPVKNQALWRTYLHLARGWEIKAEHVYGHSGHPENEACDSASTWARQHGYSTLATQDSGVVVTVAGTGEKSWTLIDGRDFLAAMRRAEISGPSQEAMNLLVEQLGGSLPQQRVGHNETIAPQAQERAVDAGNSFSEEIAALIVKIERQLEQLPVAPEGSDRRSSEAEIKRREALRLARGILGVLKESLA